MKIRDNLKFKNKTIHVEISSDEFEIALNAIEIASFEHEVTLNKLKL